MEDSNFLKIIEKHGEDWVAISGDEKLSEAFIEKFQDKVNWYMISGNQELSEDFIEKFQDKVDWSEIACYQILSEAFIEKYQNKFNEIDWLNISTSQNLSEEFTEKFRNKINCDESGKPKFAEISNRVFDILRSNGIYEGNHFIEACCFYTLNNLFSADRYVFEFMENQHTHREEYFCFIFDNYLEEVIGFETSISIASNLYSELITAIRYVEEESSVNYLTMAFENAKKHNQIEALKLYRKALNWYQGQLISSSEQPDEDEEKLLEEKISNIFFDMYILDEQFLNDCLLWIRKLSFVNIEIKHLDWYREEANEGSIKAKDLLNRIQEAEEERHIKEKCEIERQRQEETVKRLLGLEESSYDPNDEEVPGLSYELDH